MSGNDEYLMVDEIRVLHSRKIFQISEKRTMVDKEGYHSDFEVSFKTETLAQYSR